MEVSQIWECKNSMSLSRVSSKRWGGEGGEGQRERGGGTDRHTDIQTETNKQKITDKQREAERETETESFWCQYSLTGL